MSTLLGRKIAMSAGLLAVVAGLNTTIADINKALDRVPTNAGMVAAVRNMDDVQGKLEKLLTSLGAPMDEGNPAANIKRLLGTPGVNKTGSIAFAILPGADGTIDFESEQPNMVVLVPVSDYKAFVQGLGGAAGDGVTGISIDGEEGYIKDIGNGYAAMSPMEDVVTSFNAASGKAAEHRKAWGKVGQAAAEKSDAVFVMNIPMFKDQIAQGLDMAREQMDMAAQMGAGNEAQIAMGGEMLQVVGSTFANDGETALLCLSLDDAGVGFDATVQFREGSEVAGFFSKNGSPSKLLTNVPNQPFLIAMAVDTSLPGIKKILKNIGEISKKHGGDEPNPMEMNATLIASIDDIDGQATVVGGNPAALMGGGLLANTSTFVKTSKPQNYVDALKKQTLAADGIESQGMTFKSTYNDDAVEVNGVKADTWSMQMNVDPNNPAAFQIQMMMGMIFGQGGMGGMVAPVDNGVIVTMSQNTPLLTNAIKAAKEGGGLSENELLKKAQGKLPAERTFEAYLGSKTILDSIGGLMAMMGGGGEFNVPAQLTPIAFAGSGESGGVRVNMYLPADVIKAVADIQQSMQGDMDDMDIEDDGDAPQF